MTQNYLIHLSHSVRFVFCTLRSFTPKKRVFPRRITRLHPPPPPHFPASPQILATPYALRAACAVKMSRKTLRFGIDFIRNQRQLIGRTKTILKYAHFQNSSSILATSVSEDLALYKPFFWSKTSLECSSFALLSLERPKLECLQSEEFHCICGIYLCICSECHFLCSQFRILFHRWGIFM